MNEERVIKDFSLSNVARHGEQVAQSILPWSTYMLLIGEVHTDVRQAELVDFLTKSPTSS